MDNLAVKMLKYVQHEVSGTITCMVNKKNEYEVNVYETNTHEIPINQTMKSNFPVLSFFG